MILLEGGGIGDINHGQFDGIVDQKTVTEKHKISPQIQDRRSRDIQLDMASWENGVLRAKSIKWPSSANPSPATSSVTIFSFTEF